MNNLSRYANMSKILNISNPLSVTGSAAPGRRKSLFTMTPTIPPYLSHAYPFGKYIPSEYTTTSLSGQPVEEFASTESIDDTDKPAPLKTSNTMNFGIVAEYGYTNNNHINSKVSPAASSPSSIMSKVMPKSWLSWSNNSSKNTGIILETNDDDDNTSTDNQTEATKVGMSKNGKSNLINSKRDSFKSLTSFLEAVHPSPVSNANIYSFGGHLLLDYVHDAEEKVKTCRFCLLPLEKNGYECTECDIRIHTECRKLCELRPCSKEFNDSKIQKSFFRIFTTLLRNYKSYLIYPNTYPGSPRKLSGGKGKKGSRGSLSSLRKNSDMNFISRTIDGNTTGNTIDIQDMPDVWFDNEGYLNSLDRDTKVFFIFHTHLKDIHAKHSYHTSIFTIHTCTGDPIRRF
jgi:hypothetical protein